jgi:hypothetical protein
MAGSAIGIQLTTFPDVTRISTEQQTRENGKHHPFEKIFHAYLRE